MKTPEKILQDGIDLYNSRVSDFNKFKFTKYEFEMFVGLVQEYASQSKHQEIEIDDVLDDVFDSIQNTLDVKVFPDGKTKVDLYRDEAREIITNWLQTRIKPVDTKTVDATPKELEEIREILIAEGFENLASKI